MGIEAGIFNLAAQANAGISEYRRQDFNLTLILPDSTIGVDANGKPVVTATGTFRIFCRVNLDRNQIQQTEGSGRDEFPLSGVVVGTDLDDGIPRYLPILDRGYDAPIEAEYKDTPGRTASGRFYLRRVLENAQQVPTDGSLVTGQPIRGTFAITEGR